MIKTCSDERMTYMKKLVMLVTVVLTVAMAAVCFAAGDGNDLNKQQKIVDKFVAALTVADDSGYAGAAAGFSPELKQSFCCFTKAGQRYFRDNEGNEICCL